MTFHFPQFTLEIAYIIGWVTMTSSLFVLVCILSLRAYRFWKDAQEKKFLEQCRPLILDPGSTLASFPKIKAKNALAFLKLWNYYQESVKGEEQERLMKLARELKIDKIALKWLHSFSNRKKLMAILSLGYLREEKAWKSLCKLIASKNNLVSITAARALIHIDSQRAIPLILPLALYRSDWPHLLSENLFKEAGPAATTPVISKAVRDTPTEQLVRLIEFMRFAFYEKCIPSVREILTSHDNPEVISAALRFLKDPRDATYARNYASHPFWPVRLNAIKVLGFIGSMEDIPLFLKTLSDPEWWVRFTSAKALVNFSLLDSEDLHHLQKELSERAREILALASIEESLA